MTPSLLLLFLRLFSQDVIIAIELGDSDAAAQLHR
jgi:hypothetical protein